MKALAVLAMLPVGAAILFCVGALFAALGQEMVGRDAPMTGTLIAGAAFVFCVAGSVVAFSWGGRVLGLWP